MVKTLDIIVCAGGVSSEHSISLISARSIQRVLDTQQCRLHCVGIDTVGQWWYYPDGEFTKGEEKPQEIALATEGRCEAAIVQKNARPTLVYEGGEIALDLAFPVLHGPGGEDGSIQGFFETLGLPYVGCGIEASVIGIDKVRTKEVLRAAGIGVAPGMEVYRGEGIPFFADIASTLPLPLFIKPACQGSSVGIGRASSQAELDAALAEAFRWDAKVLIEGFVDGREIECAVLGNEKPRASVLGEVITGDHFYDFESKYVDAQAARLSIPAVISEDTTRAIQECACKAFKAIGGRGLARVDFFLRPSGDFLINEINTMPGFTSSSMYPALWQHTGMNYAELVQSLVNYARESSRFHCEKGA